MGTTLSGLLSLAILALDIWAIINVIKSGAETGIKILWVLLIVFLPVLGLIIWALAGPRGNVRLRVAAAGAAWQMSLQCAPFHGRLVRPHPPATRGTTHE